MSKPLLLIDVDGVVFNINKKAIDIANEENGTDFNYKKNRCWWWGDYTLATKCGNRKYFENMLDRDGFFRDAEPIEDSIEYINRLHEEGYQIMFLSAPHWTSKSFMTDRVEFLKEQFSWFNPSKHLILTSQKGICDGENRVIIDDYPYNLEKFTAAFKICFKQSYNELYEGLRLKWCEIYNTIKLLEKGKFNYE